MRLREPGPFRPLPPPRSSTELYALSGGDARARQRPQQQQPPRPLPSGGPRCAAVRSRLSSPRPLALGRAAGSPGVPPRQMVGPEDAGAQGGAALLASGRDKEAEEAAAAEEEEADGEDAEADGERDGSRGGSRDRLHRYLAGKRPPNGDACGGGRMTNGDAGFLLLSPPASAAAAAPQRGEEKNKKQQQQLHNGGCALFLSGVAGAEPPSGNSLAGAAVASAPSPTSSASASSSSSSSSASSSSSGTPEEAEGSLSSPARALPCLPALAFMDISLNSRNTFEVNRRRSAPEHLPPPEPPDDPSAGAHAAGTGSEQGDRAKRLSGIAGSSFAEFFTRNFFTKRTKELKPGIHSAPGWKLFGKVPPKENLQKDSKIIQQEGSSGSVASVSTLSLLNTGEYEARIGKLCKPPQATRRRHFEFEPLSTTALILEDRPSNLPAKSTEEALRHRQEYDEMVAEAKKREIKEAHRRKKIMKERFKQEENIASAMVIWVNEILPNWESMRSTRRVRELWWQGLPPSVRGRVWSLAVGNELNITPELYEIFLSRAKERWKIFGETGTENDTEDAGASLADREASLELIKLDISRTFPSLYIFQKGGPYHDLLHSVLGAYTCYRPDVGYVQGMSFIAAVLILNLEEADAFIAFANLLNKPCQLAFFRVDHSMMLKYFAAFEVFFEENLPKLFHHFKSYNLTPDIYLIDWIFTLYSKSLPLDLACRVWDVFCRDGEEFLFRTGLGILRLYEDILLQMDFIHIAQFLTKLPEDITSEKLFSCITSIQMQNSNKKWAQVFASLMKDSKEGDRNHSPALKS
ncbi:TBC1 domain family member 12 isoform X2 [Ahaetulla prasina]|uniref:TBC1 domain family member 12 isoform X2 n=1 Tax=Ahaetulla prasina TaxID=499056 RepID=UPI002647CACE|nr:TBC1 domain family member 12 isoform X2 [Ahaetulla prasina]